MHTDELGLPLTTDSEQAAALYRRVIADFLHYRLDVGERAKELLAADPAMPMANVLRGYMMMLMGNAGAVPAAGKALAAAEERATDATARERGHMAALGAWAEGDLDGANRQFEAVLADHPRDLLALKLVNYNYFWLGDNVNLRDSVARVLPGWEPDLPGYGYLLGMHAFGLEECGEYPAAEQAGRRAVELDRQDHWATHAVAHVLEMEGRHREGIAWLDGLQGHWEGANNFIHHLWWHRALYHLELEQFDQVLALYDGKIRKEPGDFYLDMQNAAALLWRLELCGVEVGGRWEELADFSQQRLDDLVLPFTDLHFVMALLAAGRREAAEQIVANMRRRAEARQGTYAPVIGEVALPVAEALLAFRDGSYEQAAGLLFGAREGLHRTGGSHAQRDVFMQTLAEAALRAGRFDKARELLAERTGQRASSAGSWRAYARALEGSGDPAAAQDALGKAEALLSAS